MRSLVISLILYVCESRILTAELEKRTQAFEMRRYQRLLKIPYKVVVTNEDGRKNSQEAIGEYEDLLTMVKERKLTYSGRFRQKKSEVGRLRGF